MTNNTQIKLCLGTSLDFASDLPTMRRDAKGITATEISISLSNTNRYNGSTFPRQISVAEHSLVCCLLLASFLDTHVTPCGVVNRVGEVDLFELREDPHFKQRALAALVTMLLHDAGESLTGDITSGLKSALHAIPEAKKLLESVEFAVHLTLDDRFGSFLCYLTDDDSGDQAYADYVALVRSVDRIALLWDRLAMSQPAYPLSSEDKKEISALIQHGPRGVAAPATPMTAEAADHYVRGKVESTGLTSARAVHPVFFAECFMDVLKSLHFAHSDLGQIQRFSDLVVGPMLLPLRKSEYLEAAQKKASEDVVRALSLQSPSRA